MKGVETIGTKKVSLQGLVWFSAHNRCIGSVVGRMALTLKIKQTTIACVHVCSCMQWLVGGGQRTASWTQFSSFNFMWVPGFELRSPAFVAIAFIHRVISLGKNGFL